RRRSKLRRESCSTCGHDRHDVNQLLPHWYAYLLGMYLGDGTISRGRKGVHVLRVASDLRHPEIIAECGHAMLVVMPTSKVSEAPRKNRARAVAAGDRRRRAGAVRAWSPPFGRLPRDQSRARRLLVPALLLRTGVRRHQAALLCEPRPLGYRVQNGAPR